MSKTHYVWDFDNDSYLMEKDGTGATTAVYTNEPVQYGKLISQRRGSATSYYHFDAQQSTRQLTDQNQTIGDEYVYTAFGDAVGEIETTNAVFRYVGEMGYFTDTATDKIYVRARMYDTDLGRWLARDPLSFGDGINLYTYVFNSPLVLYDASGTDACCRPCKCETINVRRDGPRFSLFRKHYYLLCYHFKVSAKFKDNCEGCHLQQYKSGNMGYSVDGGKTWTMGTPIPTFQPDLTCPKFLAPPNLCGRSCTKTETLRGDCWGEIWYFDCPGTLIPVSLGIPGKNWCVKWDLVFRICCTDADGAHCKDLAVRGKKCGLTQIPIGAPP